MDFLVQKTHNRKRSDSINIFLYPLVLVFIQFCFLFVALFKSELFFANKILIIDSMFLIIWGYLFSTHILKNGIYKSIFKDLLLIIIYIFISLWIISEIWFGNLLRIDAIDLFFKGRTFIDTLYHSAIAESIKNNGYPSININATTFLSYHALSHYIIAFISKCLNIPCFITYNYIYPVVFLPLFIFLLQKTILVTKVYLNKEIKLSFINCVAMILCIYTHNYIQDNLAIFHKAWINGESYCVSLILLFSYFCLVEHFYKKNQKFCNVNLIIVIPIYILLLSYCKISTGFVFLIGISYYVFRKNLFVNTKWIFAFYYCSIFALFYYISGKSSVSYPAPKTNGSMFYLFHFVKTYCKSNLYIILHYLILIIPCLVIISFVKPNNFFILWSKIGITNQTIVTEILLITIIASCLPGILLEIDGGSAFYFVDPIIFETSIILVALNIPDKIISKCIINCKDNEKSLTIFKRINLIILNLLFVCFFYKFYIRNIDLHRILKETLYSRLEEEMKSEQNRIIKIKKMFNPSPVIKYIDYQLFNEVNTISRKNKKNYCVFLSNDSILLNESLRAGHTYLKNYKAVPYLAVSAYIGLPVINAIYEKDGLFYIGNDEPLGEYNDFAGYSMPPAICGDKVTINNMRDIAKSLGKKHIIVIYKDHFDIVDVN